MTSADDVLWQIWYLFNDINWHTAWMSCFCYFSIVTLNTTTERADLWTSVTVLPYLWVLWCGLTVTKVIYGIKQNTCVVCFFMHIWHISCLQLMHTLHSLFIGVQVSDQVQVSWAPSLCASLMLLISMLSVIRFF